MIQTAAPSPLVLCRLHAKATFGMGCFWKPSEELLKVEGVVDTICGYTGNDRNPSMSAAAAAPPPPPTYDDVCFGSGRWVEAVRVEYDEATLTYSQLLDAFWDAQDPRPGSRQYASVIFPHDEPQEEIARAWLRNKQQPQETRPGVREDAGVSASKAGYNYGTTTIEATRTPFYRAERYHQFYWQKMRPRLAGAVLLLAVGSGILDDAVAGMPVELQSHELRAGANLAVLLGMLWILIERKLDARTVELLD